MTVPDVESMFRQHFRRELRSGRLIMEFALSAPAALERVKFIADASLILILSDINMPCRWMGKRGDGHWPPATAPILDSTEPDQSGRCLYG